MSEDDKYMEEYKKLKLEKLRAKEKQTEEDIFISSLKVNNKEHVMEAWANIRLEEQGFDTSKGSGSATQRFKKRK